MAILRKLRLHPVRIINPSASTSTAPGYPEADQLLARREPIKFDFYLSHSLKDPDFEAEWRVFFPKNLQ